MQAYYNSMAPLRPVLPAGWPNEPLSHGASTIAAMQADPGNGAKYRTIRSFVRRTGRMTPAQQRALAELWPDFGLDFAPTPLDLVALFARDAPRTLEVGFGNGETLVQQALESPTTDFIGVEVHEPGIGHCLMEARKAHISNLRIISHDAIDVLNHQVPRASLHRINIYFPDPWPKKRHHKRRLLQPSFLNLCADRLESSGSLHIATDWANYAEHIDELFAQSDRFAVAERREHSGDSPLDRPMTKFERRGLKRGHQIWDWRVDRIA